MPLQGREDGGWGRGESLKKGLKESEKKKGRREKGIWEYGKGYEMRERKGETERDW